MTHAKTKFIPAVAALAVAIAAATHTGCTSTSANNTKTRTPTQQTYYSPVPTCSGACTSTPVPTATVPALTLTFLATSSYSPTQSATFSPTVPFAGSSTATRTVTQTFQFTPTVTRTATRTNTVTASASTSTPTPGCAAVTSGGSITSSSVPANYCATMTFGYWAVMGVLATVASNDFNQNGYQSCGGTLFGPSVYPAAYPDWCVWDGNVITLGCIQSQVTLGSGSGSYYFQYQNTTGILSTGTSANINVTASDVALVWDTYLTSGTAYTFTLNAPAAMIIKLHEPSVASYQTRSQATNFAYGGTSFTMTAASSGWHGIVLGNALSSSSTVTINRTP